MADIASFIIGQVLAVIFCIWIRSPMFMGYRLKLETSKHAYIKLWHIGVILSALIPHELVLGIMSLFTMREVMSNHPFGHKKEYRNNTIILGITVVFLFQLSVVIRFLVTLL